MSLLSPAAMDSLSRYTDGLPRKKNTVMHRSWKPWSTTESQNPLSMSLLQADQHSWCFLDIQKAPPASTGPVRSPVHIQQREPLTSLSIADPDGRFHIPMEGSIFRWKVPHPQSVLRLLVEYPNRPSQHIHQRLLLMSELLCMHCKPFLAISLGEFRLPSLVD